ncbi:hypothetical protein WISP_04787 [Willisornis vidua]|uniref:Uncharacterized protein n=1 Tax=Willisornis vidua TaxID=1566151 RepID=A0ABQ9DT57_9PASS|nr:hypothetical protein WISP_04787 [Willisornis vidua]
MVASPKLALNQKSKESNQVILPMKEDTFSDKNKEHNFFITDSEPSGGDFWRDIAGEHTQETSSPHSLKKDVENMGKEELQKVLFEQIDLRRRLEQEFQVLKGNASFPVFNNFQDQMKRELAYREEMVQQLQIGHPLDLHGHLNVDYFHHSSCHGCTKGDCFVMKNPKYSSTTAPEVPNALTMIKAEDDISGQYSLGDVLYNWRPYKPKLPVGRGEWQRDRKHCCKNERNHSVVYVAESGLKALSVEVFWYNLNLIIDMWMACAGGEGFHNVMVFEEEGSPPSTYAIVMVSLSGSLLLLVALSVAISVFRRRCTSNYSSKDLSTPVVVENIMVTKSSSEKISTVDLTGPMCVNYIPDKQNAPPPARVYHL